MAQYPEYARQQLTRTGTADWALTPPNTINPVADIAFPTSTGGTGATALAWSVGTLMSGAGDILYHGPIAPQIAISVGVQPVLTTATNVTED